MKKMIALAVASAFVAPAMATDITVTGEIEYVYYTGDNLTAGVTEGSKTQSIKHNDNLINVTATEEVNGITVTGVVGIVDDEDDSVGFESEGTKLVLAGAFGELGLGDNSGAIDAVGDYTDVAPAFGGFPGDGDDAAVLYTSPSIGGLTVNFSHSPDVVSVGDEASVSTNSHGMSVKYAFDPVEVYYASEDIGSQGAAAYGLKASFEGLMFAAEYFKEDGGHTATEASPHFSIDSDGEGNLDGTSFALTYSVGDVLVGGEMHEVNEKDNTTALKDLSVYFLEYNLGSNVDIYASYFDENGVGYTDGTAKPKGAGTAFGVEYNF